MSLEHRNKQWISVSHKIGQVGPFFVPIVQGLGWMDIKLIDEDNKFNKLSQEQISTVEESLKLTERLTHSYLWILGLYELIRSLDQRCRVNPNLLKDPFNKEINLLKNKIGRLRMPLAKLEPASKYKETDRAIAYPAIHKTMGISWEISQGFIISRRELSNDTLSLFEKLI